jgi:hypothetical protein
LQLPKQTLFVLCRRKFTVVIMPWIIIWGPRNSVEFILVGPPLSNLYYSGYYRPAPLLMAEKSGGLAADNSFGPKRPPLYELIKNILREYPCGQIFKVNLYHNHNIYCVLLLPMIVLCLSLLQFPRLNNFLYFLHEYMYINGSRLHNVIYTCIK